MNNFKEILLKEFKTYKEQNKQFIEKVFLTDNQYAQYIAFFQQKKDVFDVNITSLNIDMIKQIYGLFSFDLKVIKDVVDLYMSYMHETQLTTTVKGQPTFEIENFRADSFSHEMIIPLKDRNVIANRETIYSVRKGYNVYPSVQVVMKFTVTGDHFEPFIEINLPLARKERFLVKVGQSYDMETIDKIIKKAIRQRVVCLLTTKKIKTFTRREIMDADFDDIGRYMTLIAMDTI